MILLAKGLEALGIASVMIGLVQGMQSESMWMELYLSIIGIILFLCGWGLERRAIRRRNTSDHSAGPP
jgi:hypothetical protein